MGADGEERLRTRPCLGIRSSFTTTALKPAGEGIWAVTGDASWKGKYYLLDVEVFVPETGAVEHNVVTDPYSLGLSTDGRRSLFVDLADSAQARGLAGGGPRSCRQLTSWRRTVGGRPVAVGRSRRGQWSDFDRPAAAR